MLFSILTIFPDLLVSPFQEGILRRAQTEGIITVDITNIRNFATDKHAMTDDRPFGGGEGMVMKPEPLADSVKAVCKKDVKKRRTILLSPQGRLFSQSVAEELSHDDHLILICGRYEGVDERFRANYIDEELSIGDFILSGGEFGAMIVVDAVTRILPGVLGCAASAENDTFSDNLLKHPQYTRPRVFEGCEVPGELLSGDHEKIKEFRFISSVRKTLTKRPDLIAKRSFSQDEQLLLRKHGLDKELQFQQDCCRQ